MGFCKRDRSLLEGVARTRECSVNQHSRKRHSHKHQNDSSGTNKKTRHRQHRRINWCSVDDRSISLCPNNNFTFGYLAFATRAVATAIDVQLLRFECIWVAINEYDCNRLRCLQRTWALQKLVLWSFDRARRRMARQNDNKLINLKRIYRVRP